MRDLDSTSAIRQPQLLLVAFQPSLPFAGSGIVREMSDRERDARSGDEWLLSVVGYFLWRSGKDWRKLARTGQRFHPVRVAYLDPAQLLFELRHKPVPSCQCSRCRPVVMPRRASAPAQAQPRKAVVA